MNKDKFAERLYNAVDKVISPRVSNDYNLVIRTQAFQLLEDSRSYKVLPKDLVVISSILGEDNRDVDIQLDMFLDANVMKGTHQFNDFFYQGSYLNHLYDNCSQNFFLYKDTRDNSILLMAKENLNLFIESCDKDELNEQFRSESINIMEKIGL